ncbi:thiamine pyrophosphate-binding protein [Brevirhabdus sp.]|uniref:thiamine pyrophosphate-binding protein n=1 Tax=Brevirhabdus sp. TaxID=2004514 RepID=UPI0040599642
MRGADLLVQTLRAAGVSRIYSLSGNQIMPVYDACLEAGMEIIHTRHEAAAVYMAEAHAQLTGEVGVALVTAGTGAANALGPLVTARASETPVLLLTGDSPVAQDGRGAFQEMDQVPMVTPLVKLSARPRDAAALGRDAARALRRATTGRPGPVHLSLAFDVLNADAGAARVPGAAALGRAGMPLSAKDARAVADAIAGAARPVVLCGPLLNATRAGDLGARLEQALDAPVIVMESPRGLKDPALGMLGEVLGRADLVVSLGKPVDFTLGFGATPGFSADARWIVVQPDEAERDRAQHNLGARLDLALAADPRDAARDLIAAGTDAGADAGADAGTGHADWRAQVRAELARRGFEPDQPGTGSGISPAQLCAAVQRQMDAAGGAVMIGDGGEFGQWAQAAVTAPERVINGVSGAIGGGICYALAASRARPGAPVLALMGDGTVGFHLAEFETAARVGAGFVVVIGNDMKWNAEHQIQLRDYGAGRTIGCTLSGARYDLAVAALGGHGEYVTDAAELDAALERALDHARSHGTPACVNVMIDGLPAPSGPSH